MSVTTTISLRTFWFWPSQLRRFSINFYYQNKIVNNDNDSQIFTDTFRRSDLLLCLVKTGEVLSCWEGIYLTQTFPVTVPHPEIIAAGQLAKMPE